MRKESHKYDITQCALYKKKSSKQLKKVLCITEEEYKDSIRQITRLPEKVSPPDRGGES